MIPSKIKVGILIDQLVPGGVQKTAIDEARNLKKLGYLPKLLILMRTAAKKSNLDLVLDIDYEFLSDRYPKFLRKSFKLPIFKFLSTLHLVSPILAPMKVKPKEFDIIISHGTTTSLTTYSLAKFHHIPYIAVIHDPMIYILDKVYLKTPLRFFFPMIKPIATFLEKLFLQASYLCLVDSTVHAQFLKKSYQIKPNVLYLGINPPKGIAAKIGNKIISFGRWDRQKNLDIILDLAKVLPKVKFLIAGTWSNNSDLAWFKNLILQKKLHKQVELITSYKEKDLAQICSQGRLWIHPHFEAFSLSALEAASYGLPIIIPEKSGITELFVNGKHGFFPRSTSVSTLRKTVLPLLENSHLAQSMGKHAAELVRANYTPQARAKQLASIIQKATQIQPIRILALETGHVGEAGIAGGDLLLEQMAKHLTTPSQISVIVPQSNIRHWRESQVDVDLKTLPPTFFDRFTDPWGVFLTYLLRIIKTSYLIFRLKKPAILYSSTGILPDVIPAYISKIVRPKIYWIARIHHLSPTPAKRPGRYWINFGSYLLQLISLRTARRANLVIALNTELKKELLKIGFDSKKVITLGGGVDYDLISKFKPKITTKYSAVFLGRIHPAKGVFDLPGIWKIVTHEQKNASLAIIGPGAPDIKNSLYAEIRKLELAKNILLLGFLPRSQVLSILKNSQVFLFTDHEAGWGLAVGEAMAAGLPVVGWDIGVLGSVFKNGFIKVPQNNFEAFAEKILFLLKNASARGKLARLAKLEATKLDWSKTAHQFDQILKNIVRERQ